MLSGKVIEAYSFRPYTPIPSPNPSIPLTVAVTLTIALAVALAPSLPLANLAQALTLSNQVINSYSYFPAEDEV